MPRLDGLREAQHQPQYDTLERGIGIGTVANNTALFGNANIGQKQLTNLQTAGVLSSDQTMVVKVLRMVLAFQGLADAQFGAFGTLASLQANATGVNARAEDLYTLCAYGAYFNFIVGEKSMFSGPVWYAPAGGGPTGDTTNNSRMKVNNGVASHQAILKLGKDIHLPARQAISMQIDWFPFIRVGAGQGGAFAADLSPLDYFNQFDGLKLFQAYIDGVKTRDVQ